MDVWAYFSRKEQEIKELSLWCEGDFRDMCAAEAGSDDKRGRIFGRAWLNERAYIQIHEVVVVRGSRAHREEYGYFFVVDGDEVWGYERDPSHEPAVHKHTTPKHKREDASRVTFKKVAEQAWTDLETLAPEVG